MAKVTTIMMATRRALSAGSSQGPIKFISSLCTHDQLDFLQTFPVKLHPAVFITREQRERFFADMHFPHRIRSLQFSILALV
ncbi:hypothetical protein VNO77_43785 [Canavalia gladiata]|uniref:Uncharacterized protein n=1 Tax=Canavalia gladiata TaxID=3824 RepID=A0AAN9JVF9_CANGL